MATMTAPAVRGILDKMNNPDPDYRYMATSDLLEYLSRTQLRGSDFDVQRRLCDAVIKLLTDSSSEVQAMAQRCLPPLSRLVDRSEAVRLVNSLLVCVLSVPDPAADDGHDHAAVGPRKSMRDVASLGLKSIINDLHPVPTSSTATTPTPRASTAAGQPPAASPPSSAWPIAESMLPRLLDTIGRPTAKSKGREDTLVEALELLQALLTRLAPILFPYHDQIRQAVLPLIGSSEPFVAKRATACLAVLAPSCPASVFASIVNAIVLELSSPNHAKLRTAVHATWAVSKSAGNRLAPSLSVLVPTMFRLCTEAAFQEDDELREHCLQTLESLVLRCPREMSEYGDKLVLLVADLAKYDPNIVESDDDNDEMSDDNGGDRQNGENGEEEDDYGDSDDDDFSDDDDLSWKVRRAAVKCIHAAVLSRLRTLQQLYDDFGLLLVSRFREREESVKLDVFAAFSELLKQSSPTKAPRTATADYSAPWRSGSNLKPLVPEVGPTFPLLNDGCGKIFRALKKELGSKSVKTRTGSMALVREVVGVSPSTAGALLHKLMGEIQRGLADPSAQMKTETLALLLNAVQGCDVRVLQKDGIHALLPKVLEAADDRYYKITAESLRLSSAFLTAFGSAEEPDLRAAMSSLVPDIHDTALKRLTAQDQDSEVKEAALDCVGGTVSLYGGDLGPERLSSVGGVLCDRLTNEVTRLPTVRALTRIAVSEHASALTPVIEQMTQTVGGFLRKSNTPLRLASLFLLTFAPQFSSDNDAMLMHNVSGLITDADLRLASLSLRMCSRLARTRGASICPLLAEQDGIVVRALSLMASPLLQGRVVESLRGFFKNLAEVNGYPLTVDFLLSSLRAKAMECLEKAMPGSARISGTGVLSSVQVAAKCFAEVCEGASTDHARNVVQKLIGEVNGQNVHVRVCALACLGELGRKSLLGQGPYGKDAAQLAVLSALDCHEESIKAVAAVALGGVASGDSVSGIPALVELVRQRPDNRYLLLLSLRDAIAFSNPADVATFTGLLLQVLLEDVSRGNATLKPGEDGSGRGSGQESVNIATAECLGFLAQVNPEGALPELKQKASAQSALLRASVIASIKFVVSSGPVELVPNPALHDNLRSTLGAFLVLAGDEDVNVRKNAVQTTNAIARVQPMLLVPHLDFVLDKVYEATVKNTSLVRMVDLGPFKFEEDFGLDLRKSAFDTMRTIICGPLSSLVALPTFLEKVVDGLSDVPDVRAIAQLVLSSIAALTKATPVLLHALDKIVSALEGTLNEKLKENAVRQEKERYEDSLKGALRAVHMLECIPEVARHPTFVSFMNRTVRSGHLLSRYEDLVSAAATATHSGSGASGRDDEMRD